MAFAMVSCQCRCRTAAVPAKGLRMKLLEMLCAECRLLHDIRPRSEEKLVGNSKISPHPRTSHEAAFAAGLAVRRG